MSVVFSIGVRRDRPGEFPRLVNVRRGSPRFVPKRFAVFRPVEVVSIPQPSFIDLSQQFVPIVRRLFRFAGLKSSNSRPDEEIFEMLSSRDCLLERGQTFGWISAQTSKVHPQAGFPRMMFKRGPEQLPAGLLVFRSFSSTREKERGSTYDIRVKR